MRVDLEQLVCGPVFPMAHEVVYPASTQLVFYQWSLGRRCLSQIEIQVTTGPTTDDVDPHMKQSLFLMSGLFFLSGLSVDGNWS